MIDFCIVFLSLLFNIRAQMVLAFAVPEDLSLLSKMRSALKYCTKSAAIVVSAQEQTGLLP